MIALQEEARRLREKLERTGQGLLAKLVWRLGKRQRNYVRGLLTDPETLRADLERMIELMRERMRSDPEREAQSWLRKLDETDRKRSGYLDLAAEAITGWDELKTKLAALDETRKTAEREL